MREWIYGRNSVYEVIKAQRRRLYRLRVAREIKEKGRITEILQLCAAAGIRVERVPRPQLDAIANTHQGVALETEGYTYCDLHAILAESRRRDEPPLILILDTLQDPQNLGSLLRTAEIVGVHGVLLVFCCPRGARQRSPRPL